MVNSPYVVAVIDDDELTRETLEIMLSLLGYEPELYDSAEAFLAEVGDSKATCLLIDIQLEGVSGIELGRGLAAAGFKFPVIYMTASPDKAIQQRATEAGCVALLHKPLAPHALDEALKAARRQRESS